MTPVRSSEDVFSATVYETVPLPVPVAELIVIHDDADDAVQSQSVALAVTATVFVAPAATTVELVDPSEYAQVTPACVTV